MSDTITKYVDLYSDKYDNKNLDYYRESTAQTLLPYSLEERASYRKQIVEQSEKISKLRLEKDYLKKQNGEVCAANEE
ncbi:unnamed protein product, partial [Amoebophrya sp. A120]|eukprot:GSA120T00015434001.1